MKESIESIANYRRVNDHLATAGQPTEEQLRAVAEAGYEVVINLAPHEDPRSLTSEAGLARALGLDYFNIPVPFAAPDKNQLDAFFAAMDATGGRRTLVHCLANKRVPVFLGLYGVLRRGETEDEAFALLRELWTPNEVWAAFIEARLRMR